MVVASFCNKKTVVVLSALAVTALVAYYLVVTRPITVEQRNQDKKGNKIMQVISESAPTDAQFRKLRGQRDQVSRQLNMLKKAFGQQSCEQLSALEEAGVKVEARVSVNGGWCGKTSGSNSSSHVMDKDFAVALSKFLKGKSVASFGDGPGLYKTYMDSLGQVESYTAYDGAPFCEEVTKGIVKFLDLTAPQYGIPAYDWVISVEVGEHIPAKYENIYLDNLARHAREGIILSWAVPGQFGLSHVNNKPLKDVIAQLNKRGFDIDMKAGEPLRKAAVFSWLKNNVHVYRRIDKESFQEIDV